MTQSSLNAQTRSSAGGGTVTRMPLPSVLSVLRERAGLQPDDIAFTYPDYEHYRGEQFIGLDA
jgi:hypothetical protein